MRNLDRKLLWGRSANRCAWPHCDVMLTLDEGSDESRLLGEHGVVLGEEAHIRSREITGPRHDPEFPESKLDLYENLLLLCPTHHTLIDKNGGTGWSVEALEKVKRGHESAVNNAMSETELSDRDLIERLAARIELRETKIGLAHWQDVSYELNQPTPLLRDRYWKSLFDVSEWLLTIDWPPSHPQLANAFENHRLALLLLTNFLAGHMTAQHDDTHEVDDPHHRIEWNPELYEQLMTERQLSCSGIWLLALEVTRSINFVISAVRTEVDRFYRFDEGFVLLADGDVITGRILTRLEYGSESDTLPTSPDFGQFTSRLRAALQSHPSRYGRELDLTKVSVAEWVTRREDRDQGNPSQA